MSAYVVDRAHIRFLVEGALRGYSTSNFSWWDEQSKQRVYLQARGGRAAPGRHLSPDELGQLLWDENIRSVQYRYPSDCPFPGAPAADCSLPGPIGESFQYVHREAFSWYPDPVEVLKACQAYAYQSCEHEGWFASPAWSVIQSLQQKMICRLPGYEDAPWGAPKKYEQGLENDWPALKKA